MKALYIGLMSGTSMDGVDAVLASFDDIDDSVELVAHRHTAFNPELRNALIRLNEPAFNDLHAAALAGNAMAEVYAAICHELLSVNGLQPSVIKAIGAHGQTVRHRPSEFDTTGYTIQLLNGARLAELTGIDVVCDFRSRDVAAGGQGAPLVPAFHRAMFHVEDQAIGILNIGGIANLTLLKDDGSVGGFDCGPGNVLLDIWCHRHLGVAYDKSGAWAASGNVNHQLLRQLISDDYFHRALPKSTGRDHFNQQWLEHQITSCNSSLNDNPADIQATLAELTAYAVADGLNRYLSNAQAMLVCGGGAFNLDLLNRIRQKLPNISITGTQDAGMDPMHVEAAAFAWLARNFMQKRPGNCPDVTGANGPRILGCLHPH